MRIVHVAIRSLCSSSARIYTSDVTQALLGERVRLTGWLQHKRFDQFLVLRDAHGTVQAVMGDRKKTKNIPLESVIEISGELRSRPPGQKNSGMETGQYEIAVDDLRVVNKCEVSAVDPHKHRYLHLRSRPNLQRNLRLRSQIVHAMRKTLIEELDFVEVETPTLVSATPGGAREFAVPCSFNRGSAYHLAQSPQQFKQLLMIAGIPRYFQFARCYRDENVSSERQPEFTQSIHDFPLSIERGESMMAVTGFEETVRWFSDSGDPESRLLGETLARAGPSDYVETPNSHDAVLKVLEVAKTKMLHGDSNMRYVGTMSRDGHLDDVVCEVDLEASFASVKDIKSFVEQLITKSWPFKSIPSFARLTYDESMQLYGTDKPDLRYDWHIEEFSKDSIGFGVDVDIPSDFDVSSLQLFVNQLTNPASYKIIPADLKSTYKHMVLCNSSNNRDSVLKTLGILRRRLADILEDRHGVTIRSSSFEFVWIDDFPLFEYEDNQLKSAHHPFTAPVDLQCLYDNPLQCRGQHYDLVLNGTELGGGSVRIHRADVQRHVLRILGIDEAPLQHIITALAAGAPPHAGFALGLDRYLMHVCGAKSIRDVIAFPKSKSGVDLMTGAPTPMTNSALAAVGLKLIAADPESVILPSDVLSAHPDHIATDSTGSE